MNAIVNPVEAAQLQLAALTKNVNGSKLIALDQRTAAWHDWRNGKDLPDGKPRITGTAASIVYGNFPFKTLHTLWREMMGLQPPEVFNYFQQKVVNRGVQLEDTARNLYVAFTGNRMEPLCAEHPKYPWAGVSLDGIDADAEVINEIKCVGKRTHSYAERGVLPDYYIPQVQWQLFCVPSAKEVHYWSVDAEEIMRLLEAGATIASHEEVLLSHCKVVTVKPDPVMQAQILSLASEFRQHLIDGTPPAGSAWMDAARQYVLAKQQCDEAAEVLKNAEKQLLEAVPEERRNVNGAKVDGGGVCVTYYEAEGSVDYAKLLKDLNVDEAVIAKYRKPASQRKRITLTGEVPVAAADVKLALPTEVTAAPTGALAEW